MEVGTFTDKFKTMVVKGFATDAECDEIVKTARQKKHQKPAIVGSGRKSDTKIRNNTTAFLPTKKSSAEHRLRGRVSQLLRDRQQVNTKAPEDVQVQYYTPGQHYSKHTDSWGEADVCAKKAVQRTWTCVLYLNDVEAGGTTTFPKAGAVLEPEKGKLACWDNLDETGRANQLTEHQGDDVTKGEKFLANFWYDLVGPSPTCKENATTGGKNRTGVLIAGLCVLAFIIITFLVIYSPNSSDPVRPQDPYSNLPVPDRGSYYRIR